MPGYELSNAEKQRLGSKYTCGLCSLLLRDAMQTSCGHFYCRSCLDVLFKDGSTRKTCPQDQKEFLLEEVFPDRFIRNEVQAFVVNCTFEDEGCCWKGEVRHLERHTSNCEFLKIVCVYPKCGAAVKKSDLFQHLTEECKYSLETCAFCKQQIPFNKMKQHQDTDCPLYPVTCGKCNKDRIPRGKLIDHQSPLVGDCEAAEGLCPFKSIGCSRTDVLNQREKKRHLEKANAQHNVLLLQFAIKMSKELEATLARDPRITSRSPQLLTNHDSLIQDVQNQLQIRADDLRSLQGKLQENSRRITTLERKLASGTVSGAASSEQQVLNDASLSSNEYTRRVTNFENRTADHEVLPVENNRTMEEVRRDEGNIRRQFDTTQESTRRHDRRIESIEHTLALRNVTLADLEEYVRQQEISSFDGQLLWRISDFSRKRNDAVNEEKVYVASPIFSTSRYGYKMCARVYLNGNGMGRGTHISVDFVVMRGQYDALLRWPFRQKVTFMLLDQDNVDNVDNVEHVVDAFKPDPNSSSFQKPRGESNIASGCPMFCSLAELNNHAYVRDDAMFLKIIVDTSDL